MIEMACNYEAKTRVLDLLKTGCNFNTIDVAYAEKFGGPIPPQPLIENWIKAHEEKQKRKRRSIIIGCLVFTFTLILAVCSNYYAFYVLFGDNEHKPKVIELFNRSLDRLRTLLDRTMHSNNILVQAEMPNEVVI